MGFEIHRIDILWLAAAALAAASVYWLARRQPHRWLFAWRAVTAAALVLLLLQPALVRFSRNRRPLLAVAADVSGSMRLTGRMKTGEDFLRRQRTGLEKHFRLRYYAFSSGAVEISGGEGLASAAQGTATDIVRSLGSIRRDAGEDLAGILLLSDGNQTAEDAPQRWAADLNVPVFPVVFESGAKVRDIAVQSLRFSDFAFKNTPVDVTATVFAFGYTGKKIEVRLSQVKPEPRVLEVKTVELGADRGSRDVVFTFTPQAAGEYGYAVEALPQTGEASRSNNRAAFTMDVVREKLRVLFLCGQPGPEYAFLRHALKNDPLVELVSFVILRNPENLTLVPENDLALIPFPVQSIFTKDLFNFDLLIFENFTYQRFGFLPEYLQNIRNWVAGGGGFIMIGGENSFGTGGWSGTPVGALLPVEPSPQGDGFDESLFRPRAESEDHPLLRLGEETDGNTALWKALPELDGCQKLSAKPGAKVLLRHPWGGWPVLAVWPQGKGRVAALSTNTTWRWALGSSAPEVYTRFWRTMVRYLAQSSDTKRLRFGFDRARYSSGQEFRIRLRSAEEEKGVSVRLSCSGPSGRRFEVPLVQQKNREWAGRGDFTDAGTYSFVAVMEKGGMRLFSDSYLLQVEPSTLQEESLLGTDSAFLRQAAEMTRGRWYEPASFSAEDLARRMRKSPAKPAGEKKELWSSPWLMAAALLSLLAEWAVRRLKGIS